MSKAKTLAMATPLNQAETIRQLALNACLNSETVLETAHWHLIQLANLFDTIICIHGDKDSMLSKLAETGTYLATDWAGFIDCSQDELTNRIEAIKNVSQASKVQP